MGLIFYISKSSKLYPSEAMGQRMLVSGDDEVSKAFKAKEHLRPIVALQIMVKAFVAKYNYKRVEFVAIQK